jgi:two-component system sensor histidine kinase KdpD
LRAVGAGPDQNRHQVAPGASNVDISNLNQFPLLGEGQMLRTVAHELRSPLTAIVTSAELLQDDFDALEWGQKREIVATMHRGALWLHALVENLLCDATIREGRFHLTRQEVSLAEIVSDVEPVIAPLLRRRGQRLTLEAIAIPHVLADPRRIGQVLVNLITNACKYGAENSAIDISLTAKGTYVRVAIADRGPGIPAGDETRVFDTFFRTAAARGSGEAGVGLGLSIVKAIVEAHVGRYGAYNRPEGGACFWFELPTATAFASTDDAPETEIGEGRR